MMKLASHLDVSVCLYLRCHGVELRVVAGHGRGEMVHPASSHHPHATTVTAKPSIDTGWKKSSYSGVSLFL